MGIFDTIFKKHSEAERGKTAEEWFKEGVALGRLNRYEEAIKCFDKALKIEPGYSSALNHKNQAVEAIKDKKVIERLIQDLKEKKEGDIEGASEALGKIGNPATEPLIQALKDEERIVRKRAASALGKIGDERAVEPLIQTLKDNDEDIRENAAVALGNIGDERAVEPLIQTLKDNDVDVRESAAVALGNIGDERAVEPLIQTLKDNDVDALNRVAVALGNIGDGSLLPQPVAELFLRAAVALGNIGDARAVEPLIQALKDENVDVRNRVAVALGNIGDAGAVEPLIQALKDESWYQQDKPGGGYRYHYPVRESATIALEKIGEPAVKPLIQALKDKDEDVRSRVAAVLDKQGWKPIDDTEKGHYFIAKGKWDGLARLGKPAVEPLIQALKDEDEDVRKKASETLDRLDWEPENEVEKAYHLIAKKQWDGLARLGKPAVEPLIHSLDEYYDYDVIWGVADTLGKIGDERAVEPLIRRLNHGLWVIVGKVAQALGEIGDERAVEPLFQVSKNLKADLETKEVAFALGVKRSYYNEALERYGIVNRDAEMSGEYELDVVIYKVEEAIGKMKN